VRVVAESSFCDEGIVLRCTRVLSRFFILIGAASRFFGVMEAAKETSDSFDSFSSLGTYWRALLHTPHRVWQRGCAVSTVTDQMTEVRKSKHASS
jgi:hypothetical protein